MSNVTQKKISKLWEKSSEIGNPRRSEYLSELATALWVSGKIAEAVQVASTLVESLDSKLNSEEWFEAKKLLCQCLYASERYDEAKTCISEALRSAELFGVGATYGVLCWFQADNEAKLGNFDAQMKLLIVAIEELNRNGLVLTEGAARLDLGSSLYEAGRIEEALVYLTSAIDLLEDAKAIERVAFTKFKIGKALFDKGSLVMSKKYFLESMALYEFLSRDGEAQAAKLEVARCLAGLLDVGGAVKLLKELKRDVASEHGQLLAARADFYHGLVLLGSENDLEARKLLLKIEPVLRSLRLDDLCSTIQNLQLG